MGRKHPGEWATAALCMWLAACGGSGTGAKDAGDRDGKAGDSGSKEGGGDGAAADAAACAACDSGLCIEGGVCVECVADSDCKGDKPQCDPDGHTCEACVPGFNDICPQGQYCDKGAGFTCKVGCNLYRCTSGVCEKNGDCSLCIDDSECTGGRVCSTRQCLATCGASAPCPDGLTCCGDHCADLAHDEKNCKTCGKDCGDDEFCGEAGCAKNNLANVCDAVRTTFLLDGLDGDDAAAKLLLAAFKAKCGTATPKEAIPQSDSNELNQQTGQPVVSSGELVVGLGGRFGQNIVSYLEDNGLTRSYNRFDGKVAGFYRKNPDGTEETIVEVPYSAIDANNDWFVIEAVTDPISRARVLKTYGLSISGTNAAEWFMANRVLTSPDMFKGVHYIYQWTNADNVDGPSDGDTFKAIVSE